MSEELDINAVVAQYLDTQTENFFRGFLKLAKGITDTIRVASKASFAEYIKKSVAINSRARSFFHRGEPVELEKFHVPLGIECGKRSFNKVRCKELTEAARCSIIEGHGGSGKSVLLKSLFMDCVKTNFGIPALIELKDLNEKRDKHDNQVELIEYIISELKTLGLDKIGDDALRDAIKAGVFILLFDGYDELDGRAKEAAARELRALSSSGNVRIILTSRPDHEFNGWTSFTQFNTIPLTLGQAKEIVDLSPVDAQIKKKFNLDLEKSLYKKHKSFLSNPLLLCIMLFTYGDAADIPNKLSVFYTQAYDALFQRHDSWKGAFSRKKKSGLDILEFSRLFSAFSILTYDKTSLRFTREEAMRLIQKASDLCGIKVDPPKFLDDANQAVCLLVEEGLNFTYAHKNFQEFFCARYISEALEPHKEKLLLKAMKRVESDSVVRLLHEMQPDYVEKNCFLPTLSTLMKVIGYKGGPVSASCHLRYLRFFFRSLSMGLAGPNRPVIMAGRNAKSSFPFPFVGIIIRGCGQSVGFTGFEKQSQETLMAQSELMEKYKSSEVLLDQTTAKNDLVAFARLHGLVFSSKVVRVLGDIKVFLEKRSESAESCIEDLLGLKS